MNELKNTKIAGCETIKQEKNTLFFLFNRYGAYLYINLGS